MPPEGLRFVLEKRVREIAGNPSHNTLLRWERLGLFPKRRKIGPNRVAYLENEINSWLESKAHGDRKAFPISEDLASQGD